VEDNGTMSFENFVDILKSYSPAVMSMLVGPTFSKCQWDYSGKHKASSNKQLQNHCMLLVGISKTGEDTD
jgi:hypothetical protein